MNNKVISQNCFKANVKNYINDKKLSIPIRNIILNLLIGYNTQLSNVIILLFFQISKNAQYFTHAKILKIIIFF